MISTTIFRSRPMITFMVLCSMVSLQACSVFEKEKPPPSNYQQLVVDKQIHPMSRNEVIYAIKECESQKLRAMMIFGKRKVNGYTKDTVIDVTCAPIW